MADYLCGACGTELTPETGVEVSIGQEEPAYLCGMTVPEWGSGSRVECMLQYAVRLGGDGLVENTGVVVKGPVEGLKEANQTERV